MISIYIRRINNGLMLVEDVPTLWRNKVEEALKEQ
jgi:hypothetical protein